ncbi:hypothetical protein Tco_0556534 [Tanacetum coccineum]
MSLVLKAQVATPEEGTGSEKRCGNFFRICVDKEGFPPSPDYIPGPEEPEQAPPSPVYLPYVSEPVYPEYIPPEDDVLLAEEQPLHVATSPTAESPGYIPESDPEEDPARMDPRLTTLLIGDIDDEEDYTITTTQ